MMNNTYPAPSGRQSTAGDDSTTIGDLRRRIADFVTARDWDVYHTPKSLSMSIAIEAAELMEQFQWVGNESSRQTAQFDDVRQAVADEMADVLIYLLALANSLGLDLSRAFDDKLKRSETRYPPGQLPSRYRRQLTKHTETS